MQWFYWEGIDACGYVVGVKKMYDVVLEFAQVMSPVSFTWRPSCVNTSSLAAGQKSSTNQSGRNAADFGTSAMSQLQGVKYK